MMRVLASFVIPGLPPAPPVRQRVDAARTQVWGDGSGTSLTVAGTMTLNLGHSPVSNSYTVYGSAPPGQNAAIGSYADVLLMTVTY